MGYPHEETDFALAVRREMERQLGKATTLAVDPAGGPPQVKFLPGEPPFTDSLQVLGEVLGAAQTLIRGGAHPSRRAQAFALVQLGAIAERACRQLKLEDEVR